MNPNMYIESQGELSSVNWVWISAALIFAALMCFCIVLLAHQTKQSAMTQAQAVLNTSVGGSSPPRSEFRNGCYFAGTVHQIFKRDS
jgi:hypothetical protein